jgi:flagellar basal body P-ring protein FlgI
MTEDSIAGYIMTLGDTVEEQFVESSKNTKVVVNANGGLIITPKNTDTEVTEISEQNLDNSNAQQFVFDPSKKKDSKLKYLLLILSLGIILFLVRRYKRK